MVIVCVIFIGNFRSPEWTLGKSTYYLVANSNISFTDSEKLSESVERVGGAGMISDLNNEKNCVIILCYNSQKDAEKIKSNSLNIFPNTSIICVKSHKISNKVQNKLNNNIIEVLKFISSNRIKSNSVLIDFERGDMNFNKLYEYVYKTRNEIKRLSSAIGEMPEDEMVKLAMVKLETLLDEFLDRNIKSEFSSLYFKKYIVTMAIEDYNLRNYFINL